MDKLQLVQYVIVRGDLATNLNWPLGAIIAQCCHAATAVCHLNREDAAVQAYFADLDNMHKVVLRADDEAALQSLARQLTEADIRHKLWIEMPEEIATCVALKPYNKVDVQKYVKKFKLFK